LQETNNLIASLTANVNNANSQIDKLTNTFSGLKTTSSQCNDKILELSTNQQNVQAEITKINQQIEESKSKLAELTPTLNSIVSKRDEIAKSRDSI
jgi:chromosome segregation ATPase